MEEEYGYELGTDEFNDALDEALYEVVEDAVNNLGEWYYEQYADRIKEILYEGAMDGGISLEDLKEQLAELYIEGENGEMASAEVARQIVEGLGYDGIIDDSVSQKFRNMNLSPDTVHYSVFESNQAKLTTNENPTSNYDIRYSLGADAAENVKRSDYSYKTLINKSDINVYDSDSLELRGYEYSTNPKALDILTMTRKNIKRFNDREGNSFGATAL